MNENTKRILDAVIDIYGCATGVAIAYPMLIILNDIRKYGMAHAWHSTGDFLLWIEIIAVGGFIPYSIYKFFKSITEREKLNKCLKREKIYGR